MKVIQQPTRFRYLSTPVTVADRYLNKNGEIIGIITSKNSTADGVVFAAKSKNIYKLLEAAKKSGDRTNIKLPNNTGLKGLDRVQQIKKMEEFVFMVVGN